MLTLSAELARALTAAGLVLRVVTWLSNPLDRTSGSSGRAQAAPQSNEDAANARINLIKVVCVCVSRRVPAFLEHLAGLRSP